MKKGINLIKRLIMFFIGMSIIQLGVALFLKTNIGSDTFTVFTQGLAETLNKTSLSTNSIVNMISGNKGVTPGVANMIILIVMFSAILCIERKRINIGTLICVVGVGPIIDLWRNIISYISVKSYILVESYVSVESYITLICILVIKMLLVVFGCFIIAVGFSILSAADIGVAPNDIVPFIIVDKTNIQYKWVRIALDAVFLIGGYFLGGKVGIGTILSMLAIGPFIQMCLPVGKKFVDSIVNENQESLEEVTA